MKISIMSDMHWEVEDVKPLDHNLFDVLVIAGDAMSSNDERNSFEIINRIADGKDVIFVPGNHEFDALNIKDGVEVLKEKASSYSNIHILNNETFTIGDNSFIGSTLWSNLDLYNNVEYTKEKIKILPDFQGKNPLLIDDVIEEFNKSIDFINKELDRITNKKIVVTHFAPHKNSISKKFINSPLNPWFTNNLSDEFICRANMWIHGHTHENFQYNLNHKETFCKVICNPVGFSFVYDLDEYDEFTQKKLIETYPDIEKYRKIKVKENGDFYLKMFKI